MNNFLFASLSSFSFVHLFSSFSNSSMLGKLPIDYCCVVEDFGVPPHVAQPLLVVVVLTVG